MRNAISLSGVLAALAGCADAVNPDATNAYSPPEAFGLVEVRPYPTPLDVCSVIGESETTVEYLDDAALLIGCPVSEDGAIADRRAEGAREIDVVGDWVLLSIPLR